MSNTNVCADHIAGVAMCAEPEAGDTYTIVEKRHCPDCEADRIEAAYERSREP